MSDSSKQAQPRDAAPPGEEAESGRLRPSVFSTAGYETRDRLDAYSAQVGPYHDFVVGQERRPVFQATCSAWPLGKMLFTSNTTAAMGRVRRSRQVARDGLDHWILRVNRTGGVRTRFGDAVTETGPRQLVAYSYAEAFEAKWEESQWVSLLIPRDEFPALTRGLSGMTPGIRTGAPARLLADVLLALPDHLEQASEADTTAIAEAIRATVSACLLAGLPYAPGPERDKLSRLAMRERVRHVVRGNIASPSLTPERICQAAGISRSGLYRMFELEGGVARYIQRTRLALFRDAICDPALADKGLAALGERFGFFDGSALSRMFRRAYGATPRDVRAAALLDALPTYLDPMPSLHPAASFTDLLRHLAT